MRLTAGQRNALEVLAGGSCRLIHGSLGSLERRGLVASNGERPHPLWRLTDAGRVALGLPVTYRAAGTLDLTVHVRDMTVEPKVSPAQGESARYRALIKHPHGNVLEVQMQPREFNGHAGHTVCGKVMWLQELWVPYVAEDRDPMCEPCAGGVLADDEPDLWDDVEDEPEPPTRPIVDVPVAGGVL